MNKKNLVNKSIKLVKKELILEANITSHGIAIGPLEFHQEIEIDIISNIIQDKDLKRQIEIFNDAIVIVRNELEENANKTKKEFGEEAAELFIGQKAILDDEIFLDEVIDEIKTLHMSAEAATFKIFQQKRDYFLALDNQYFHDRAFDIRDLKRQIILAMRGEKRSYSLNRASIILAKDITPSDTIHFNRQHILGFVSEIGGKTSHSAILARKLGIPSVSGIKNIESLYKKNRICIIDALNGKIIIDPKESTLQFYLKEQIAYNLFIENLQKYKNLPTELSDGYHFEISANVEFTEDLDELTKYNIKTIGLYRTEGYYLKNSKIPDEETQYQEFLKLRKFMTGNSCIVRTLDLGGDKLHQQFDYHEDNPFLGWRAIRLCLDEIGTFNNQLRALIRASIDTEFKIMLPMIIDISEIREAKSIINTIYTEFDLEKIPYKKNIEIGIMIETPASAFLMEKIIHEVDFVSIGTNDLIQYMLCVDRGNEKVSHLYQSHHPAVLGAINHVISVANKHHKLVSMCGEMAGDMMSFPILIGMGLRNFSMSPAKSLIIRRMMGDLTYFECHELYEKINKLNSYLEINTYLDTWFNVKFPDLAKQF